MNPFFFGTSAEPLFGVFHPPKSPTEKPLAVLLCCPLGQEYMRSHRAFRQLALLLSRAGFHVMRFDYYGTGDSAGDSDAISIEHCVADVEVAVEELRAMSGVPRVALVGLRMGASIAALAASRVQGLSHIILWDPVTDGRRHLLELLDENSEFRGHADSIDSAIPQGTVGVRGFPLTSHLRDELRGLDIASVPLAAEPEYVVVSSREGQYTSFCDNLRGRARSSSFLSIPSEGNWNEVDEYGSALIPQAVIRGIVDHLTGGAI